MNIDYINPFVEASYEILKEILQVEIRRGEIYLKGDSSQINGIGFIVGLIGEAEGRLILDIEFSAALKIASIMNQEEFQQIDEMVIASIGEIANMITASAVTKLHAKGYNFDLTPPSIIKGKEVEITNIELETLVVPLELPFGKVEINIAIEENL